MIHIHSHSVPSHCSLPFQFITIYIHIQCHHTVLLIYHTHTLQCSHTGIIISYHHSYAFTFCAITLFSSLHFITHLYVHSVPSHYSHNFLCLFSFTFSTVPSHCSYHSISSLICIHIHCHHTVFITSFYYSQVFIFSAITLFS